MGDRIAQIVFEKLKTPAIKEVKNLEGTERGSEGFGSTSVKTVQQMNESVKPVNEALNEQKMTSGDQ